MEWLSLSRQILLILFLSLNFFIKWRTLTDKGKNLLIGLCQAKSDFLLLQFFNSVRLWDFIEDRESRTVTSTDDQVTELGELFMHLSGAEEDSATSQ